MRALRGSALAAALVLACSAQTPGPAGAAVAWCTHIPLPGTDFSLRSDVDGHQIHRARDAQCRPLEVRTGRTTLRLAVAANEAQRERGLMKVPFLPANQGMIFVFPDGDQTRGFWMKDTITPLDMIFVRSDGTITSVAVNVPATAPKTPDDKVARRSGVGRFVIEVGAGAAGELGLIPGARLIIPPVAAE